MVSKFHTGWHEYLRARYLKDLVHRRQHTRFRPVRAVSLENQKVVWWLRILSLVPI